MRDLRQTDDGDLFPVFDYMMAANRRVLENLTGPGESSAIIATEDFSHVYDALLLDAELSWYDIPPSIGFHVDI